MTREEASNILNDYDVNFDGHTAEEIAEAFDVAFRALDQEPRWIPVSERLPKSSGVYIVSRWFSDGEENAILTDANYYDGNGYWYNDNRINWGRDLVTDKIVAWMPLPEPYKGKNESEEYRGCHYNDGKRG